MKILQAFDFLSLPYGGGTVDIVCKLSKALAKRGHEVTICTGDYELDEPYMKSLMNEGVQVTMNHSWFNKYGFYLVPSAIKFDVSEYDIIHLHCYRSFLNVVLGYKALIDGVPYIIDSHGSTVRANGSKRVIHDLYDRLLNRLLIRNAGKLIAETEVGADEYLALGVEPSKIRLLHPLLDTSEFANLPEEGTFRKKFHLGPEFMVLFLGRLHHAKGIDTLVDAVRILKSRGIDLRLVLAGQDDGYGASLASDMWDMPLGRQIRLSFTGFVTRQDKLATLVDADVLVQSSRNEAGARPSLEAIMCKTPVIVSGDTGAGKEIARFDGGLLFKSGDAEELANAIQEIIDRPGEARNRTDMARKYIIKNLSLDNGIAGYEKLYEEAVS